MSNEPNVYFKQLSLQEKKSKLALLPRTKINQITLWIKGSSDKYKLTVDEFFRSKNEFQLSGHLPEDLNGKEILFTFELSGLHFFGKCDIVSINGGRSFIDMKHEVFKSERRANFRLLTYPHHEVYISIKIDKEELKKSNVVNLQTKVSQTKLFKNFLNILDEGNDKNDLDQLEDYLEFRVIDVSVTGLAFQFGEIENSFFKDVNIELGQMYLNFNGECIPLSGGKILYKLDFLSQNKKNKLYKAGVIFTNVDTNLDSALAKIINETMRSIESEFEDFLK
jgi:hypothetical protein